MQLQKKKVAVSKVYFGDGKHRLAAGKVRYTATVSCSCSSQIVVRPTARDKGASSMNGPSITRQVRSVKRRRTTKRKRKRKKHEKRQRTIDHKHVPTRTISKLVKGKFQRSVHYNHFLYLPLILIIFRFLSTRHFPLCLCRVYVRPHNMFVLICSSSYVRLHMTLCG